MLQPKKLFVIRKYVLARSAKEAIRAERKAPVDDVWLDDDWKKANVAEKDPKKQLGYSTSK